MNYQIKVRDPVCLMEVKQGSLEYKHKGLSYSFCSQQCQDRFNTNPHLYIGQPGKPAPKQLGKSLIRKRVLELDMPIPVQIEHLVKEILGEMMGIKIITIESNTIQITYDLLEVTIQQIETTLEKSGEKLSTAWAVRLKRAFIHYLEDTELDNLEHQYDTHGCHH